MPDPDDTEPEKNGKPGNKHNKVVRVARLLLGYSQKEAQRTTIRKLKPIPRILSFEQNTVRR